MAKPATTRALALAALLALLSGCAGSPDRVWYWPRLTPRVSERTPRADYNRAVFDYAWKLTNRYYYDATFGGHDWPALRKKYRAAAASAQNDADLYEQINTMLAQLGSSHLAATPPDAMRIRKKARDDNISLLGYLSLKLPNLDEPVVYEVTPHSPAADAGVKPGWLQIGAILRDNPDAPLREGETVRCIFRDEHDTTRTVTMTTRVPPAPRPGGAATLRPGGVLCLRIDRFDPPAAAWVRAMLKTHETLTHAVVLDLRLNAGGAVSACRRVLGEFFSTTQTPVKAGAFIDRNARAVAMRANISRSGANYRGPLVVLVSRLSASGAEVFASAIQESGRGVIVGMSSTKHTAGAVLMSADFALPGGGSLQIPVRDYISPRGARLETTGVRADIDAPLPTIATLRANEDPALDTALATVLALSKK